MNSEVNTSLINHVKLTDRLTSHHNFLNTKGNMGEFLDLSYLEIHDFDFSNLRLNNVVAMGTTLLRCNFSQTEMTEFQFESARVVQCNFSEALLLKAEWYETTVEKGVFDQTNLERAEFTSCTLIGLDLNNCNLQGASFSDCILNATTLENLSERKIQVDGINRL
tara:strand:+ start:324 stop:818 length:495 start_codon:yes stop_codon:yes gene_type:complete